MSNFGAPGALPGVYSDITTASRGVSIPGGSRISAMIGEGSVDATIVTQAQGSGLDGLNPTFTSTNGAEGRYFQLQDFPLISNRTTIFKNGVPLVGLEALIGSDSFSDKYDYRIDINTGRIELQTAHLYDQGGAFFSELSTNVGDGYLSALTLEDVNAPPETWTVRCVSVQRNSLSQPIQSTAKFLAFGSVSGAQIDANGNPIVWVADGYTVSNGILSFAIYETQISGVATSPFREGDGFLVKVASGVLVRSDSLTANYIPTLNLNDPVLLQGLGDVVSRHGLPSVDNNLSLGAQLAFANSAPALLTVQAAPSMPRRTSYQLEDTVNSTSSNDDDFIFPLPIGVTPDFNSSIHFFVTNNSTQVESQILPNKLAFYTLDTSGEPTTHQFITSNTSAPAGWSYFYTVKESLEAIASGEDGYIGRDTGFHNKGLFSSEQVFDSTYVGKALKIIDATNAGNIGIFDITSVINGKLYVAADAVTFSPSTIQANPTWLSDLINTSTTTAFQVINATTGVAVDGYAFTNGSITTSGASTGTGTIASTTFLAMVGGNYSNFPSLDTGYKIKITSTDGYSTSLPVGNEGLYDIVSHTTNTITLRRSVVNESNMRYEVLDPNDSSKYIVVNKNVVPNGNALRITIVDDRDASFFDAGWINALESLEKVECDILVPLPKQTISVIFQNALNHCKTMSNIRNRKERVLFIGAINGLTPENLTGAEPAAVENIGILEGIQGETITDVLAGNIEDLANYSVADAFGNTYRCVYFYPDQIVVQAGADNVLIDGFYIAAAAAGYESADVQIQNPLTNKVLSGFTILRNKQFSPLTLEQLAGAGVTTLQPVSGGGRVVWGITTSQSGFPEEQEISIVFIRDRVAKTLRAGFAGFIGTPEDLNTPAILNTRAVVLLNSLVSSNLITNFKNLSVQRDSVDPTQWNISVMVQPVYPVNFIYIKIEVGQL